MHFSNTLLHWKNNLVIIRFFPLPFFSVIKYFWENFFRKMDDQSRLSYYKYTRVTRGIRDAYTHVYIRTLDLRINIILRCRRPLFARVKCARIDRKSKISKLMVTMTRMSPFCPWENQWRRALLFSAFSPRLFYLRRKLYLCC